MASSRKPLKLLASAAVLAAGVLVGGLVAKRAKFGGRDEIIYTFPQQLPGK
jgi:hypothetical protein